MLKDVLKTVNEYLETITDLVKTLVIIGIIVEIIFPNRFGVIENLREIMEQFGDAGFAGLLAIMMLVMWYEKIITSSGVDISPFNEVCQLNVIIIYKIN